MINKAEFSILIVDDSMVMRKLLLNILKKAGYCSFQEAREANEAFKILKEQKISLILIDWIMPGMSGLDFLEKIRNTEDLKSIPVLMISSEALSLSRELANKQGINGYINKPFEDTEVIDAVNHIYENCKNG